MQLFVNTWKNGNWDRMTIFQYRMPLIPTCEKEGEKIVTNANVLLIFLAHNLQFEKLSG